MREPSAQHCNNQHLTFDRYGFTWHKKNEEKGQISLLGAEMKRISYYGKSSYIVVLLVYDRLNFNSGCTTQPSFISAAASKAGVAVAAGDEAKEVGSILRNGTE